MIKKKIVTLLLVCSLILGSFGSISFGANYDSIIDGKAKIFRDISAIGNKLSFSSTENTEAKIVNLQIIGNTFSASGSIEGENSFNIKGRVTDYEITDVRDLTNNYEVVSVYIIDNDTRLILTDKANKDMIYVDIDGYKITSQKQLFYNRYWYTQILEPEKRRISGRQRRAYNTNYDDKFEREYEIYGDRYTEILEVGYYYNWPEEMDARSDGSFFKSTLNINSKKTILQEYGETREIELSGCSLEVTGAEFHVATDQGQYVESMQTYAFGDDIGSGFSVDIGFWLDIPKVPFGITTSYDETVHVEEDDEGYYSFHVENSGSEKAVQVGTEWDPYEYHLVDENDYFKAEVFVCAESSYVDTGRRNKFSTKWEYEVVSSGINQGHAVDSFYDSESFSNSLYYDLTE
ncbi:hypothetical protein [Paramaledivibacter caminithermalis]|jgi:hypothetical protein|uniref:Uncharacterized protein n=1 Tax=Paramaledivibacter caminithermalis (strain DSM 15212 / CIP 107654 / DViRD3) TaxID=1121301 RepID=A0A1M6LPB6_PARC5|nr:hypothetical protein [Paramaledivibacter caminithermalis]SHJ73057.1 hypothetical protein SAMN02745912_00880 [Paramaledivibacter caminithermalis DSM 15212]